MRTSRPAVLTAATAALALALTSAPVAQADPSGEGDQGSDRAGHSLRGPVTDETFYFVMADRFANGDTGNDTGGLGSDPLVSGFDPTRKGFYNGGDLKGLLGKLDYIQGLGTDSIWLTPSFKNKAVQLEDGPSAGYHGYWITDFTRIDPHLGSNADLAALIDAAHDRGMKVYFDIITNQTADVIGYEEGARTAYVPKDTEPYRTAAGQPFDDRDYAGTGTFPQLDPQTSFPHKPVLEPGEENLKVPAWLNDTTLYHNRGNTTFTGEDSQYGDFFGLDDLFTENPRVVDGFIDIYRTWVKDFGVDGFRIDTMKHVDDEFWKAFGPGLVDYAKANGKPDFFMFGEVFDQTKSYTSHFTTEDGMQAVLDFPFQDAARKYASQGRSAADLESFFESDDWYTDADSNVYELPTFLGNHDMGRIGQFVVSDNPDAGDAEWTARDRLAHELMYFSRGNPVVYYGDEQGFTGASGGDQNARQTMFASKVPDYLDDDLLGTSRTHAQDNFEASHPLYRQIAALADLARRHPALRDGAHQMRFAANGTGVVAFSRTDREEQREYVVALNNSESPETVTVPTYSPGMGFAKVYGDAAASATTGADRGLPVTVPPLSTVVYRADGTVARSQHAPAVALDDVAPAPVSRSRMHVGADVAGDSFYEVTFQVRGPQGSWRSIGTDDTAPYQVFHDTAALDPGTRLQYRALVLDNAGHVRPSAPRSTQVPSPSIRVSTPSDGGTVTNIDPVTVKAVVDPERPSQSVRFERRVGDGAWTVLGTDTSSPEHVVTDDVEALPLGSRVSYRAVLLEAGQPAVTAAPVTVTTAEPKPARTSVTVAGSLQSEIGCVNAAGQPTDWDPACAASHLSFDKTDGLWHGTWTLPAGSHEWKVAINDSWTENYGAGGAAGGSNLALTVPEGGATYRFTWNQVTHVPSAAEVP
ncbi:alpha-amylase [Nocardioides guangzhouensis]|uniref:Alpha-amylase n=1 Tax=Nocardioides guangzhouensis TaxID=2497878 RepID=A0A4Q4Z5M4_9ACTN|nr:alpha-amylase family glycosyl hydrolase [Nocardioides guangzhouensis]RYP83057.1 alpha-amylase [Nocardioides guangzhouensis]